MSVVWRPGPPNSALVGALRGVRVLWGKGGGQWGLSGCCEGGWIVHFAGVDPDTEPQTCHLNAVVVGMHERQGS